MGKIKEFIAFKILKVPKYFFTPPQPLIVREQVNTEKIKTIVFLNRGEQEGAFHCDRLAYLLGKKLIDDGFVTLEKHEDYDKDMSRIVGTVEVVKRSRESV